MRHSEENKPQATPQEEPKPPAEEPTEAAAPSQNTEGNDATPVTKNYDLTCPAGHTLLLYKVEGEYICDGCAAAIAEGHYTRDCRNCDYTLCISCLSEGPLK